MFGNCFHGVMLMPMFGKKKWPCLRIILSNNTILFILIIAYKIFWGIACNGNTGNYKILVPFGKRYTPRFWAETAISFYMQRIYMFPFLHLRLFPVLKQLLPTFGTIQPPVSPTLFHSHFGLRLYASTRSIIHEVRSTLPASIVSRLLSHSSRGSTLLSNSTVMPHNGISIQKGMVYIRYGLGFIRLSNLSNYYPIRFLFDYINCPSTNVAFSF